MPPEASELSSPFAARGFDDVPSSFTLPDETAHRPTAAGRQRLRVRPDLGGALQET